MAEYAKDALTNIIPWKQWQFRTKNSNLWQDCSCECVWYMDWSYRRKLKTILINGIEVPEPLRVAPSKGTQIWYVGVELANHSTWEGYPHQYNNLQNGGIHLTKEAAELHAKALRSFTALK